jgi:putative tryptophan/tyrosine transport system substrate-binding protein
VRRPSRREFLQGGLALVGLGLLSRCGTPRSQTQSSARVPRIGYLGFGRSEPDARTDSAFRQGLAELGYVEGGNLAIEWRFTDRLERLPDLAAELVQLQVAVIVGTSSPAVNAAKAATTTIPIVTPSSGDPVAQGFATSLARPGGNITGLTTLSSTEIAGKRLELLKEIAPEASRVAVLWNPGNTAKVLEFQQAQTAATALGLTLHSLEVRGPDDFDRAFNAAAAGHVDAVDVLSEGLVNAQATRIAAFALKNRLPSVFEQRELVQAGGLISYGPAIHDLYRRAATYVDKILNGANPADLPIEQPTTFDFVVNLKTAQALGLVIPPSVLQQATELIQ